MDSQSLKLTWLASFSHFITHGFMTLLPAILVVITAEQSISFTEIGIIANIGYFLYGLGSFPAGFLADRFGSKRVLTLGLFGMAVSSILVGLSHGLWDFALAYSLLGMSASIHHPAGLSLIARRVGEHKGRALGLHGVMGNVGLFLTPLVAGLSVKLFHSWRAAYLIYGVIGIFFAMVLYRARVDEEEDLHFRDLGRFFILLVKGRGADGDRLKEDDGTERLSVLPVALIFLYLGSMLSGFIFRGSLTFLPTLLKNEVTFITNADLPVVIAAYVTTAVLLLGLIGAWYGGYINDKLKRPELFPALVFVIVAPLLYGLGSLVDNKLLVTACFFSLIYYAWQPAQNYLIAKYTRKASHGMGFGVNFFLIFGIGSLATSSGGYVTDNFGVDRFYLIMAMVGAAAVLSALAVYVARRHILKFTWRLEREE